MRTSHRESLFPVSNRRTPQKILQFQLRLQIPEYSEIIYQLVADRSCEVKLEVLLLVQQYQKLNNGLNRVTGIEKIVV